MDEIEENFYNKYALNGMNIITSTPKIHAMPNNEHYIFLKFQYYFIHFVNNRWILETKKI